MAYRSTIRSFTYVFDDLKTLLAKATPYRSGDALAGLTAATYEERVAAQIALADVPLKTFLNEVVIPYETDDVTRLIIDTHDANRFAAIAHFTVGDLRDWLFVYTPMRTDARTHRHTHAQKNKLTDNMHCQCNGSLMTLR